MSNVVMIDPSTGDEIEDKETFVDAVISKYQRVQQMKAAVAAEETALIKSLSSYMETEYGYTQFDLEGMPKKVELTNIEGKLTIKPRMNASYPKERDEPHPLAELMRGFPQLTEMVAIRYEESGSKVQKFLDSVDSGKYAETSPEYLLAQAIKNHRKVGVGKPELVFKPA